MDDIADDRTAETHFRASPAERRMYRRVLPTIDRRILRSWIERDIDGFLGVLSAYDDHAAGLLTFEYADVIADFYV